VSASQEQPATLTDDDIETRPVTPVAGHLDDDTSDSGDDSGDTSDTSDTGDDSGDTSDSSDSGDDSGDDSGAAA
jgi:hypothetical protein